MEKVAQFIEQHSLIEKNKTILVAVSGGPDSVALLHYLNHEREKRDIELVALTVNHQLREDAAQDITFVEQLCKKLNIKCVKTKINVKAYQKKRQISTQVAARELRYQFFREQMELLQADYLAFGHHADDQLETMLMGFTRTASTVALSGIPIKRSFASGYIIRPFLCLTKAEINHYCQEHQLNPMIDPSNADLSYTRNYFRKQIVPLLKEQNANIHQTIQNLSEILQDDEQYLLKQAKKTWQKMITIDEKNEQITFNRQHFLKQPNALQRRIYHLILNYLYNELPSQLTYTHAENFFALLKNRNSYARINFPRRLLIEKSYDEILLYFKQPTSQDLFIPKQLNIPGQVTLSNGSILQAENVQKEASSDRFTHIVAVGQNDLPLSIRTRQPGDRMSWRGLAGRKKIKDIFIDEKVPRGQRDQWPIVVTKNGAIIWLIGLKKGQVDLPELMNKRWIKLTYKQQ